MSKTITKHIGEGKGRGELYRALAYDSSDVDGGMCIKQVRFNPASGAKAIQIGDSTINITLVASTPQLNIYTTSAATTGDLTTMYIKYTHTGDTTGGGVIFPLDVLVQTDTRSGGIIGAIRAKVDFNDTGYPHGVGTVLTTEAELPNTSLTRGAIYPFEIRLNAQASSTWASAGPVAFMRVRSTGAGVANIDSNAYFMIFYGHTGAAGKLVSANSQTVKCSFSGETDPTTTVRYLLFSQIENGLGLGSSGTPMTLTYNGTKAFQIYTTCASTNTGISYEPVLINTVMTGGGQVGGRVKINMSTNVVLGGWANALKAQVECNTNGRATGTLSAFCGEVVMPASNVSALSGSYAALEAEINTPENSVASGKTSFIYFGTGGNSTAKAAFLSAGVLFELVGFGTPTDDVEGLWHLTKDLAPTHALRVRVDDVFYDILMVASAYSSD